MFTRARTNDASSTFLLFVGLIAAILLMYLGVARAATGDPSVPIGGAIDTGLAVWTQDGPLWLAITVLYIGLRQFLAREHFLQQGRLLAVLTGLAGMGAAVLQWRFNSAPSTGILTALLAAIALVQHPVAQPAPQRNRQLGRADAHMLVVMAVFGLLSACALASSCAPGSTARQTAAAAAAGVVAALDCEAAHLDAQALADARAFADAKVRGWISGHVPGDAAALQAKIKADLEPIKSDLGHCAITGALAAMTTIATADTAVQGRSSSSAPGPDPVQLRAAFSASARVLGWAPVKVASGTVL